MYEEAAEDFEADSCLAGRTSPSFQHLPPSMNDCVGIAILGEDTALALLARTRSDITGSSMKPFRAVNCMFRWHGLVWLGIEALPDWLLEEGLSGHVQIVNTSYGRGLQAGSTFFPGDDVLSVPLRHMFSIQTVGSFKLGRLLADPPDLSHSDILAATLAAHAGEPDREREAVVMQMLPSDLSDHPLFYSDDTWKVADRLVSGRLLQSASDEVLQSWYRVSRVLQKMSLQTRLLEPRFRWAHAILRSRGHAIRLRSQDGEWLTTWGLIPLADMINMDPKPNVDCRTRYAGKDHWGLEGKFVCKSLERIDPGQDLWTEYVSRPELRTSATFLRDYGFVPTSTGSNALSWLPPGCTRLHCMVRLDHAQLEEYFGEDVDHFLEEALRNSSFVIETTALPALKLLAQQEKELLLELREEWLAKTMFKSWRGEAEEGLTPTSPKAQQLFEVLRSPEALHTVEWDRAVWAAGHLLISQWDEALAAEVLYSHHDFAPELEQVFRAHRREAINKSTLQCAFAAQALLNDFAWPVTAEERDALSSSSDPVLRAMFVPEKLRASKCPRAEALQSERDWEEQATIETCPYWRGSEEPSVQELYASHPYPSWRRFGFMKTEKKKIRRSLIAGVGTGKAVLAHMQHFDPQEILAVDLSKRSLQVAKRQLLALGVRNVALWQCDLTTLEGQFDVIESVGVLHHLPDPAAGFAAVKRLLAPAGTLVLGLYSRTARRSIPVMRDLAGNASYHQFRAWLTSCDAAAPRRNMTNEEEVYRQEFLSEFSISSRSTFEDLLHHPVEHVFELPQLEELLSAAGLKITGVRVPPGAQGVADRWLPYFAPQRREVQGWPPMPLLAFLHRIETEKEPLLFTNMYVFTASHGSSGILGNVSHWVSSAVEDAEALPLPFEPEWSKELLDAAIRVFCSRLFFPCEWHGQMGCVCTSLARGESCIGSPRCSNRPFTADRRRGCGNIAGCWHLIF